MLPSLADLIDLLRTDARRLRAEKRRSRSMPRDWIYDGKPDDGVPAQMLGGSPIFMEEPWTS